MRHEFNYLSLSLSLFLSLSLSLSLSLTHTHTLLQPNYHQLGPKPFPLDRLMAIFYSILEESVSPSIHVYSQVHKTMLQVYMNQLT